MSVYFYIDDWDADDSCRTIEVDDSYWEGDDGDEVIFVQEVL